MEPVAVSRALVVSNVVDTNVVDTVVDTDAVVVDTVDVVDSTNVDVGVSSMFY